MNDPQRLLIPKVTRVVAVGSLRYLKKIIMEAKGVFFFNKINLIIWHLMQYCDELIKLNELRCNSESEWSIEEFQMYAIFYIVVEKLSCLFSFVAISLVLL